LRVQFSQNLSMLIERNRTNVMINIKLRAAIMIRSVLFKFLSITFFALLPQLSQVAAHGQTISGLAIAEKGMVSTQETLATNVGVDILKRGGNAIDAAVATGFALAVTYPQAGNLGGGGYMVVYLADKKQMKAIDYREMAPGKAHKDMFLDEQGNVDRQAILFSGKAVGVPGTVAGLIHALENYGTMSLEQVMAPAIELAEQGFNVPVQLNFSLNKRKNRLLKSPTTRKKFFPNGQALEVGSLFKQPDLARTLKLIAKQGRAAFYEGEIAKLLVADSEEQGGIISLADLKNYRVIEREPIEGSYRGYQVFTMPPPSSGGVHLIQMLNVFEGWDIGKLGFGSFQTINKMAETMRFAYADRSVHLGDPDFYDVPLDTLISKKYAADIRAKIERSPYTPSSEVNPGKLPVYESPQTTHFSIIDQWGNAVANTYTINATYGNGHVAKGTGFLLNNEMDDFSAKAGVANLFGLVGGTANAIEPGKRPLSSMTPTIIMRDGKVFMVTGGVGGSLIITATLQTIVNVIDHQMNIAEATSATRFHHQYLPDVLSLEYGFTDDTITSLKALGYKLRQLPPRPANALSRQQTSMAQVQSVLVEKNRITGNADNRRNGALAKGH
jgi:gamma-glutamyltranspeptidase / glutathione hydrolase